MHWFWRAAIAAGTGCILLIIGFSIADAIERHIPRAMAWFLFFVFIPFTSHFVSALLPMTVANRRVDSETHCRRCGYVLRGLTEPRCPECGERV